jgi:trans-2,3-dihydro-3-hydroxyanthranilate isomerase
MTAIRFFFVDVFAARPLTGNPLVVVPDADTLGTEQMRALAREFNQSETTFVLRASVPAADWQLRSFTPIGAEVGGAGHNALGACLWLAQERLPANRERFVQQIGTDLLPVQITRHHDAITVAMDQSVPVIGNVVKDRKELAASLGLDEADLSEDSAVVISTGAGHLLVPLRGRKLLERTRPDNPRLQEVLTAVGGEGCYVYCLVESGDTVQAHSRFFNPTMGIWEDPATGTAAGPLAVRLVRDGVVADGSTTVIEQGREIGRPSLISVTVSGDLVRLSGGGLVVAEGTVHL